MNYETTGVIIVDHGSRRQESNAMLLDVVALFKSANPQWKFVEPAHMEMVPELSISAVFRKLVDRGVKLIIIHPFFLLPGKHWSNDIPRMAAEASTQCDNVTYLVTAPLATHPLMAQIMQSRIDFCIQAATGGGQPCEVCQKEGRAKCQFSDTKATTTACSNVDIEDLR